MVMAVTHPDWFRMLREKSRREDLDEVNFWSPNAGQSFKALQPGELFLFKLRGSDKIAGGGVFSHANSAPCSLAWSAFGEKNGAHSLVQLNQRMRSLHRDDLPPDEDFEISCRILTRPFFFADEDHLTVPSDWSHKILNYKTYSTDEDVGKKLWDDVLVRLQGMPFFEANEKVLATGAPQIIRTRLGQGGFRILVTDIYRRRCSVSGERTLPALEAAHIRASAEGGSCEAGNGLLLRSDIRKLFDEGYVTVNEDLRFEVSDKIYRRYGNGKSYYALRHRQILLPDNPDFHPKKASLRWHNEQRYKG